MIDLNDDLPPTLSAPEIHKRLQSIFPEGCPNRNNCVWEIASKTIFVMIYVGAIEGRDVWIRPDQVTRMTDKQTTSADSASRLEWIELSLKSSKGEIPGRWYAVNTRESIRDDTLRSGLIPNGAAVERSGLPTTSPAPRYALQESFASLFNPSLKGRKLEEVIVAWQETNLSSGALARITMRRKGVASGGKHVMVTFPNDETRRMVTGPSSLISKAVIEDFSKRFLHEPGVIFLSESANKVVARDEELAKSIGLSIEVDRNLPDIILVDLGPSHPLLVFVEVVATDGPVNEMKKAAFQKIAKNAGFSKQHIFFVTAYNDRSSRAFKKTVDSLAWGTFAWFASEPEQLLILHEGQVQPAKKLIDLL
jgi:hypothetical protein